MWWQFLLSMHGSQYVTDQLMHGSMYVTSTPTWRRCWLQSFSVHPTMKIKKLIGYKTLGAKTLQFLQGIWWTRPNFVSDHNLHAQPVCIELHHFASPLTALKISLYMSRVVRKETLYKYPWIYVKKDLEIWIW